MEHIIYCPQPGCGASAQIVDRWVCQRPLVHPGPGHAHTQPTPSLPELARA